MFGCAIESGTKKNWNYFQCWSNSLKTTPEKKYGVRVTLIHREVKIPTYHCASRTQGGGGSTCGQRGPDREDVGHRYTLQSRLSITQPREVCRVGSAPPRCFLIPPAQLTHSNETQLIRTCSLRAAALASQRNQSFEKVGGVRGGTWKLPPR